MTREEEYYCTILSIYTSTRDFIKWSKPYGLTTELKSLVNGYITMIDLIMDIATQDSLLIKMFVLIYYYYMLINLLTI
jgi:hypothetical protein